MFRSIRSGLRAAVTAAAIAFSLLPVAAHAETVNFEANLPNLYAPGESFVSQTMQVVVEAGTPGFAVVDSALSMSIFGNAPTGNASQYLAGFNDAVITLTAAAGAFYLNSFEYAFIPPVLSPGTASPGALVVEWMDTAGHSGYSLYDFGAAGSTGAWAFRGASFATGLAGGVSPLLQSVSIFACLYSLAGTCDWPAGNLAQFAVDNIVVTPIPEPSTWALMGLGLLALLARRRWASSSASE